jgi:hypothetical protein
VPDEESELDEDSEGELSALLLRSRFFPLEDRRATRVVVVLGVSGPGVFVDDEADDEDDEGEHSALVFPALTGVANTASDIPASGVPASATSASRSFSVSFSGTFLFRAFLLLFSVVSPAFPPSKEGETGGEEDAETAGNGEEDEKGESGGPESMRSRWSSRARAFRLRSRTSGGVAIAEHGETPQNTKKQLRFPGQQSDSLSG